ncbi:MAG: ABC transporter permease [Opitutales bacterium]|nr:ABC transporter permease [Opitutales bacterium]
MNIFYGFFVGIVNGLGEIWSHKIRSILSMIGIILGCAALVAMMSVVDNLMSDARKAFEEMGGVELIEITRQDVPAEQQEIASLSKGLTIDDAYAIRYAVPLIEYISPQIWVSHERVRGKRGQTWMPVFAIFGDNVDIGQLEVDQGRNLCEMDMKSYASVAVVGSEYARVMFAPGEDPIGKFVRVRGSLYQIVGVMKHYERMVGGRNVLARKNRLIYIPITTAAMRYRGDRGVNTIYMKVRDARNLSDVVAQIENTMNQMHNGIQDFAVSTRESELEKFRARELKWKVGLGGVALISLFVGGIGIMNVMLAVINERIREIGVRKALGARSSDIFMQFLAESVVISFLGGLFGMALSIGLVFLLKHILGAAEMAVPFNSMIYAMLFSITIGIVSGVYPSLRAARLDPITALRYE